MSQAWLLLCFLWTVTNLVAGQGPPSVRRRREWKTPPVTVTEGDQLLPKYLSFVISNSSSQQNVMYKITGPGVDRPPIGVFYMEPSMGRIYQHKVVDREEIPSYTITVQAYGSSGEALEIPFNIIIDVKDINDNPPQFSRPTYSAVVTEASVKGTFLAQVTATDRDQPQTPAATIAYRILSQKPQGNDFRINPANGVIRTNSELDRETVEYYVLFVEAADNNGDGTGLSSTATVSLTVADINDNAPKIVAKEMFGVIDENTNEVVVARVGVTDADKLNTSTWRARYTFLRGNEGGEFRVPTDPVTNEGVITLVKPLDFETSNLFKLVVLAENEVPLVGVSPDAASLAASKTQFTLRVRDVDERPRFLSSRTTPSVMEGSRVGSRVTTVHAVPYARPGSTAQSNIRYGIQSDPAGWFVIDPALGEITTKGVPDRESHFVVNGTYTATVTAIDPDTPTGMSTCTLVINLVDANDNPPELVHSVIDVCDNGPNYVEVTANDSDSAANGAPFTFEVLPEAQDSWAITETDGVSAIVRYRGGPRIPRGVHVVPLRVSDRGGLGATPLLNVSACPCSAGNHPRPKCGKGGLVDGAIAGILAGVLGLLLAAILLLCCCCKRGKSAKSAAYSLVDAPHSSLSTWTKGEEIEKFLPQVAVAGAAAAAAGTSLNSAKDTTVRVVSTTEIQKSSSVNFAGNEARAAQGGSAGAASATVANGAAAMRTEQSAVTSRELGLGSAAGLGAAASAANYGDGPQGFGGQAGASSGLGGTAGGAGGGASLARGGGAALGSWSITTLGSSGFRVGPTVVRQDNAGWAVAATARNEHSGFASAGLAKEGGFASGAERGAAAAFSDVAGGGRIYEYMAESLRIMESDSNNAAPDSLLIYNREGHGASLLSLSCSDVLSEHGIP